MHWVLQSNLFVENSFRDLVEQLDRQGTTYDVVKIVPFVGEIEPDVNPEGPVFVCGSTAMKKLAARKGWKPGYFDDNINMSTILKHWGDQCLNYGAQIAPIGQVKKERARFHIRPDDDKKSFAGVVMDWEEFEEWREKIRAIGPGDSSLGTMDIDTPVVISHVKEIYAEYRFFVVNGRVVTCSQYKNGTLVQYKPEGYVDMRVKMFVDSLIQPSVLGWRPCEAFVVDVADTPLGLKVIECNSINSAGFYAADMGKFVSAINDLGRYYV